MKKELPKELKKWNWGAFFLNWIWGIGTESWQALWAVIPFFGFIWAFVCGAKGNQWAWESQKNKNIARFNNEQKEWAFWGFIISSIVWTYMISMVSIEVTCTVNPNKCPLPKSYMEYLNNH